jgi:hypothetical protein
MAEDPPSGKKSEESLTCVRTANLGGSTGTMEFTDEVTRHVKTKLEVWSALA